MLLLLIVAEEEKGRPNSRMERCKGLWCRRSEDKDGVHEKEEEEEEDVSGRSREEATVEAAAAAVAVTRRIDAAADNTRPEECRGISMFTRVDGVISLCLCLCLLFFL